MEAAAQLVAAAEMALAAMEEAAVQVQIEAATQKEALVEADWIATLEAQVLRIEAELLAEGAQLGAAAQEAGAAAAQVTLTEEWKDGVWAEVTGWMDLEAQVLWKEE